MMKAAVPIAPSLAFSVRKSPALRSAVAAEQERRYYEGVERGSFGAVLPVVKYQKYQQEKFEDIAVIVHDISICGKLRQ